MARLKKLLPEQVAAAVGRYESGESLASLGTAYGVSRQAMWDLLRRRTAMRSQQRHGVDNHFFRGGSIADDLAHNLVEEALEGGQLQRRTTCENCGSAGVFKDGRTCIQAHHDDYNKPLEVRWLCQRCHHEWHKHNQAIARREVPQELDAADIICGGFP